jgi:hypothetical protein
MKNLFLLMALILTFAEFNAVAHGADTLFPPISGVSAAQSD